MADRYLLESGAPDGYLLEDSSGVLLLEEPPAFPVETVSQGAAQSADGTTTTVTVPAVASGDRLLIWFTCDGASETFTWPGSPAWTEMGGEYTAQSITSEFRYRDIDGTEGWGSGGTFDITIGSSERGSVAVTKIDAGTFDPATAPNLSSYVDGSSTSPDPPSLNPADWDAEDTLWIALMGYDCGTAAVLSGYPSDYPDSQATYRGTGNGSAGVGIATRELNASSDDPEVFALDISAGWHALTVAIRPVTGGTAVDRTATDALTAGDSLARLFVGLRTIADASGRSDAATRVGGFLRSIADGVTYGDAATQIKTLLRTAADAIGLGNAVTRLFSGQRIAADARGQSDAATRQFAGSRSVSDSRTQSDAAVATKTLLRSVADAVGLADAATRTVALLRSVADASSRADVATRAGGFLRSVADSLTLADAAIGAKVGQVVRTATEAITHSDVATRTGSFLRTVTGALSLADAAVGSRTYLRSVTDAVTHSDAATRTVAFVRSATDTTTYTDLASRVLALLRSTADAASLVDAATRIVSGVVTGVIGAIPGGIASLIRSIGSAARGRPAGQATRTTPTGDAQLPTPGGHVDED